MKMGQNEADLDVLNLTLILHFTKIKNKKT